MNLWIILAITWISISVVIADSRWFVQDTPLVGEEGEDLFSTEHLLRVDTKHKSKTSSAFQTVKSKQPEAKPESKAVKSIPAPATKSGSIGDVEEEDFLLVNPAGRKPLQIVTNKGPAVKMTGKPDTKKTTTKAPAEWFIQDSSSVEMEGKDGLFPTEQLIRVSKSQPKPAATRNSNKVVQTKGNRKAKKAELKVAETTSQPKAVKKDSSQSAILRQTTDRKSQMVMELKHSATDHKTDQPLFLTSSQNAAAWFMFGSSLVPDGGDDLSEEHLMRVQTATKTKPKTKPKSVTQVKTNKKESLREVPAVTTPATTTPGQKSVVKIVKSEDFLPADTPRRKPLNLAVEKQEISSYEPSQDVPCDKEKDIDCLMEDEDLILVNKRKTFQPNQPKIDHKPLIKQDRSETVKKETKIEAEKPKVKEIRRESLHRRLLDSDKHSIIPTQKAVLQPLLQELDASEVDDVTQADEDDDVIGEEIESHLRFRRQADSETSGDGGFESEQNITGTTHSMPFNTTLNMTRDTLTEEDKRQIAMEFVNQTRNNFTSFSGFEGLVVTNVTLDENGRVVLEWQLIVSTSAAPGNTQEKRRQETLSFITETVVPFINNELNVSGSPVYEGSKLEPTVIEAIAQNILGDPCQTDNACPNGFICIPQESICRHRCYHNGFSDQCRHGSTCQLDSSFNPYCQCGSGYSGEFCDTPVEQSTYSTGQVAGAGAAGAVAAIGAAGAVYYFAVYRRKKEEEMEYSYFGDDDQTQASYSDVSSNLGVGNNYYINRPSVSITPLDIYNQNGDHGAVV